MQARKTSISVPMGRQWNESDFRTTPVDCAKKLVGTEFRWKSTGGIVVETEAYAEFGDEACHTFVRNAARDFVRNQAPGTIYAYLNYGIHWLFNVLTKHETSNGFVLIRAIEPLRAGEADASDGHRSRLSWRKYRQQVVGQRLLWVLWPIKLQRRRRYTDWDHEGCRL